jgi:DME family drug/metabolite transporter
MPKAARLNSNPTSPALTVWGGRLLIITAALMWSTSGFFAKAPIFDDWPEESRGVLLAFWRALFAALILIVMVRRIEWTWKLIPMVLTFALMNWTYLTAMVYCESTLAIWLQYTAPAWVFLISWLWFRDRPVWRDWLLLGFASFGVAVILQAELFGASPVGVRYGLASGVFFAGVIVMLRILKNYDAAWIVFLNHMVTAILLSPALIHHGIYPSGSQWFYLASFGMLQIGIPYLLFARGLNSVTSHEASGLTLLEPLLVPVWVFLAWHNAPDYSPPAWSTILGAGLILTGLLLRYWGAGKSKANPARRFSRDREKPEAQRTDED